MRKFLAGALVLAVLFQWTPAFCETRTGYVSDMLILTFREGPGTQFKVLKSLPSDTRLTILEEGEKFFKAQLESGDQGWVDKRFVIFTPTKTLQIQALEKEKQQQAEGKTRSLGQQWLRPWPIAAAGPLGSLAHRVKNFKKI